MKIARTDNTIKGSIWGIVNRIVCTVVPFIIRTIVIYVFGMEYLGLNSLFTSILPENHRPTGENSGSSQGFYRRCLSDLRSKASWCGSGASDCFFIRG